jgi:hypothetical protein
MIVTNNGDSPKTSQVILKLFGLIGAIKIIYNIIMSKNKSS